MPTAPKRFPKPAFEDLLKVYDTDAESVHLCAILNPTAEPDGINTCAARMSEALCLANKLVANRSEIARHRAAKGVYPLLGAYGYTVYGNLCSHGIARGARDLGEFLIHNWGTPKSFTARSSSTASPAEVANKRGVVCFVKLPTYPGQGHIDLWDKTFCVGHSHWDSEKSWFWELP
jgi:hypothetical protein